MWQRPEHRYVSASSPLGREGKQIRLDSGSVTNSQIVELISRGGDEYRLTRFVILRLLGFVYAVAFLVAATQLVPLIGQHGLTPATHFLNEVRTQLGSSSAGM